jgi:VanZ family protein
MHSKALIQIRLLTLAYTLLVIPFADAIDKFQSIPFLQLGIQSRADWVANALLFIPLTYLWSISLPHGHYERGSLSSLAIILLIIVSMIFSAMIEFFQLYFPQRTVSQNDIMAETIG